MSETIDLSPREEAERARQARDEARGYRINMKYLGIAFVGEGLVITLGLVAAILFAIQYGKGDPIAMGMMMMAPIGYAVVEMTRVPLALLMRTQPSFFIKLFCFLGMIAAAVVTAKTLSQVGEIMFRPRLIDVTEARHDYHEAVARRDAFQGEYTVRKEALDQASASLTSANETSAKQVEALKETAKPQNCPYTYKDRNGRTKTGTRPCPESAASKAIRGTMSDQQGTVTAARERVNEASKALKALGTAEEVEAKVVEAKKVYDKTIMHSQLHAFTGMFFAKDPAEVTEGELSNFLRLFVFLPAICASLASTLLALGSVTKIKPKKIKSLAVGQKVVSFRPRLREARLQLINSRSKLYRSMRAFLARRRKRLVREVEKIVEVPVDREVEKIVEITREVPVERIVEKPVEIIKEVPVERVIEKIVEITKEVPVEHVVEKTVEVVKEVPVDRVVEKEVLKEVLVERIVEKPIEIVKEVPVDRVVIQTVEKIVEVPVEHQKLVEVIKEVPVYVEKVVKEIVEKPVVHIKEMIKYVPDNWRGAVETKDPTDAPAVIDLKRASA